MQTLKEFKSKKVNEYILFFFMLIQFSPSSGRWTHVKELPNTKLLVSLNHKLREAANMAIFDLSRKVPKKIYTFEKALGGKINSNCINCES